MKFPNRKSGFQYSTSSSFKARSSSGWQKNDEDFALEMQPDVTNQSEEKNKKNNITKVTESLPLSQNQNQNQKKASINKNKGVLSYFLLPFQYIWKAFYLIFISWIRLDAIICTWFYIGKIPIMSGTLGSLAAYPVYYLVLYYVSSTEAQILCLYYIVLALSIIGLIAIWHYQRRRIIFHDHHSIVIDEVIGQLLTIAIALPSLYQLADMDLDGNFDLNNKDFIFLVAFVAFRFFDIRKPLGIMTIQIHMRNALGVILDDVMAAAYASLTIIGGVLILQLF